MTSRRNSNSYSWSGERLFTKYILSASVNLLGHVAGLRSKVDFDSAATLIVAIAPSPATAFDPEVEAPGLQIILKSDVCSSRCLSEVSAITLVSGMGHDGISSPFYKIIQIIYLNIPTVQPEVGLKVAHKILNTQPANLGGWWMVNR